ncbi:hypothetical protein BJX62DRAFT_3189 [Aspergillus germanicus]
MALRKVVWHKYELAHRLTKIRMTSHLVKGMGFSLPLLDTLRSLIIRLPRVFHLLSYPTDMRVTCSICREELESKAALLSHVETVHGRQPPPYITSVLRVVFHDIRCC